MALDPLTAGIGLVDTFIGKFVKDKDLDRKLESEEFRQEFAGQLQVTMGQLSINLAEANSGSVFKGGWRPAAGWTCVFALAYKFVLQPFLLFVIQVASWGMGIDVSDFPTLPVIDAVELMPILLGMLGLSWNRMQEKVQGVSSK